MISSEEIDKLWKLVRKYRNYPNDQVNIKFVSEKEVRTLNRRYRGKDTATNVLTFSYVGEHDIAVCLPVAEREAIARGIQLDNYTALLLVHAFLHATGMDHELSEEEADRQQAAEREILKNAGFSEENL